MSLTIKWVRGMLALVVALALFVVVRPTSSSARPAPRPTPTIPNLTGDPTPEPEPSPSQEHKPNPNDEPDRARNSRPEKRPPKSDNDGSKRAHRKLRKLAKKGKIPAWVRNYRTSGSFSTAELDFVAQQLTMFGWHDRDLVNVYRGLPIGGSTSWTNSWGAPRHEFGHHFRRHEGQDLFCERGAAVLAVEDGRVEFDVVELGGRIARLWRPDGSYWYYAHLSRWNEDLSSGDRVSRGDVIGNCGTTGNAVGTPPHVHFGWYSGKVALNPIAPLSMWLGRAENHAHRMLTTVLKARQRKMDMLIMKRHFGDELNPALGSDLKPSVAVWWSLLTGVGA